jgi:D-xylose transport system substrate-binding protein
MHSPISRRALAIGGALCALAFGVAACGSDDNDSSTSSSGGGAKASKAQKVGVLLPDTKSSVRWESFDRPLLEAAFKAAGVPVTIDNAQGDKSTQQQQAEQQITNGAKVLLLVNLDSGSGAAIEANAQSRGV